MLRMDRYFQVTLAAILVVMVPLGTLSFIGERRDHNNSKMYEAHIWQRETKSVAALPNDVASVMIFKKLRLADVLSTINTIVIGSSTLLTITREMFPDDVVMYNYAIPGRTLAGTIQDAQYLVNNVRNISRVIISVDWFLGYQEGEPAAGAPNFLQTAAPGSVWGRNWKTRCRCPD